MLFLLFRVGLDRYALPAAAVREVLPLLELKSIPQAPVGVAGLINLRGAAVPVLDLRAMMEGVAAAARSSTRIVVVEHRQRLLGLIAEHATETIRRDESEFVETVLANAQAPYLGPVLTDSEGVIQKIDVNSLIPPPWEELLFKPTEVAA